MKLFGSSGIRAVYDSNLLQTAYRVGLAAGQKYGKVILGRDTRVSGVAMNTAVTAGLRAAGADCHDAGIAPTPTIAFIAREFDTGIVITASHNPPEYNGIKLFNPDGSSFDTAQQAQIETAVAACSGTYDEQTPVKQGQAYRDAIERHIGAVLSAFPQKIGIKVVVDAGGGAASNVTPRLLEKMGCEVIPLNCTQDGSFPRGSEPNEANLAGLRRRVIETGAALGIAHDGDADRMMAVDEKGRFISGDVLLALFIKAGGVKDIVTTLDATMAVDEMGIKVRRTRIGDSWVSEELRRGGDFGGETAGAWIFPRLSLCPDGIYAAACITSIAAGQKLSSLVDGIPVYPLYRGNVGGRLDISRLEPLLVAMNPRAINRLDGIKMDFVDGWLLVRPSGTEPKIRLTAEARTERSARDFYERGLAAVKSSVNGGRSVN